MGDRSVSAQNLLGRTQTIQLHTHAFRRTEEVPPMWSPFHRRPAALPDSWSAASHKCQEPLQIGPQSGLALPPQLLEEDCPTWRTCILRQTNRPLQIPAESGFGTCCSLALISLYPEAMNPGKQPRMFKVAISSAELSKVLQLIPPRRLFPIASKDTRALY